MTNQAEAMWLFDEANLLWQGLGQFNQALSLYREALKHDPSDPVILYQLANALWAFEQFDSAREAFLQAEQHQYRLSEYGKEILSQEKQRLIATVSFKLPLPIPASELSFEKLDSMGLNHEQWMDVAFAAEKRRMFGLAADALDRSMPFIDPDIERDKRKLEDENRWFVSDLKRMRPEAQQ